MNTTTNNDPDSVEEKLVNVDELLEILWTKQSRPSSRWLRDRTDSGEIPHVPLGGRIFYSVDAVKEALIRKPKYRGGDTSDEESKKRADFEHNKAEQERRRIAGDMRGQE